MRARGPRAAQIREPPCHTRRAIPGFRRIRSGANRATRDDICEEKDIYERRRHCPGGWMSFSRTTWPQRAISERSSACADCGER